MTMLLNEKWICINKPKHMLFHANKEIRQWLVDNFGEPCGYDKHKFEWKKDSGIWYTTVGLIYFKYERDAILFNLRWS